jgi:hypothetical protein
MLRGGDGADARGGGGPGAGRGGELGRRYSSGTGRVGEGRTLARLSSSTAGDGDARVLGRGVTSGRRSASEKGGASKRSLSSGRGASRTGASDDDRGRETRGSYLGKMAKCR